MAIIPNRDLCFFFLGMRTFCRNISRLTADEYPAAPQLFCERAWHWSGLALVALTVSLSSPLARAAGIVADVQVSASTATAHSTTTSPTFSTRSSGELLLAFVAADSVSSPNTTVKSVSGAALTWQLVVRTNARSGSSEIWRAWAPSTLSNATVTATLSQSVVAAITVMSFTGASSLGTNGSGAIGATASGSAASGAPAASLATTGSNSLIVGVGNDYDNAIARSPNSGQELVSQDLSSTGDTYWVQREDAATAASGTRVTLGDSAPTSDEYNFSVCEILAPSTAAQATLSASSLNFGSVTDGSSETKAVTITSTGGSPLVIGGGTVTGAAFGLVAASWPQTVAPGHSLTLEVQFAPAAAGAVTGQLAVSSNATGGTSQVALSGTGTAAADPQLTLSTTSLNFGSVQDGSGTNLTVQLTSTGSSPVTVSSDSITGSAFSIAGGSLPATLNPQQSLSLKIQFLPTSAGSDTGKLTIASNSVQGSTASVALTGTGLAPRHSVELSWNAASGAADQISGYHIYRAAGGTFTLMNSSLETQTDYTDQTVAGGITYQYEVKSVDPNGIESVASNEIVVTVPSS